MVSWLEARNRDFSPEQCSVIDREDIAEYERPGEVGNGGMVPA